MIFNLKALSIYSTKTVKKKKRFLTQGFYPLKPRGKKSTTIITIVYNILSNKKYDNEVKQYKCLISYFKTYKYWMSCHIYYQSNKLT